MVDNDLIIEASHEERVDEHGFVSRQFKRRYVLPQDVDQQRLESDLSPGGALVVQAPKVGANEGRTIPIQFGRAHSVGQTQATTNGPIGSSGASQQSSTDRQVPIQRT